jgi:AcrR family transcriptional regulator
MNLIQPDTETALGPRDTHELVLKKGLQLFSEIGFDGVSMRQVARAVNVSPATLYHHFEHKEDLYMQVLRYAYGDKADSFSALISTPSSAEENLRKFIEQFAYFISNDHYFFKLVKREQLSSHGERLKVLVDILFGKQYEAMVHTVQLISTNDYDPHMAVTSLLGLILHHYETRQMRQYFSGYRQWHDQPEVVAKHCFNLFMHGVCK